MKKTIVIVSIAVFATAFIGVTCYVASVAKKDAEQQRIADEHNRITQNVLTVIKKEEKCRNSHIERNGNFLPAEYRHYIKDIEEINADNCPSDFRQAWFNYVTSCRDSQEHPILNALAHGRDHTPHNAMQSLDDVAIKYGITFKAP